MQIKIHELLSPTLEKIAQKNNLSPETYAANIVNSFLERNYRAEILDDIKLASVEEIKEIKDKIKSK